jgi:hypothetical protein
LLKNVAGVELFQVLYLDRSHASTLPDSKNFGMYATEHVMVQKRNEKDWQKMEEKLVFRGSMGKYFDVNQAREIEDL